MSEKTPLISTPGAMPLIGPKTKDYAMVLLWPFALAVCFAALFIFLIIVPPMDKITLYGVVTLVFMLLPCVPVVTAIAFVATSSKKVGNVHFWTTVAVCTLVACYTLTNDRIVSGEDVSHYCEVNKFKCGHGVDLLTDVTLGAILVTVVFGVLGASATSSLSKKLDLPPMPINA